MAINIPNIPPNAVQLLFAEDLIKWLLRRQAGVHYETEKAGPYRDFIFNVFNSDVQEAVNFIEMSLEGEIEKDISYLAEISENTFLDYALYCEDIYFKKGFLADCFLEYCVRLVSMAVHFVLSNVPEALNISLNTILKLLEDRGMFEGGWNTVIAAARKYAKVYEDFHNVITPNDSLDEPLTDISEDEHEADISAESLDMNEENQGCDCVSDRDQLQKPEREFETDDLSTARESSETERSSKSATNADFNSGHALEETSSEYELLPSAPEKSDVSSTSNGESSLTIPKIRCCKCGNSTLNC